MDWRQFVMDLEMLNPDSVEDILVRHGATSISFSGAGREPVLEPAPGETPLWPKTRVAGLFAPDADLEGLLEEICRTFGIDDLPSHRIDDVEDRAWELEWARDVAPMRFGRRLWVCPGDTTAPDAAAVTVRLDPGMAFGSGTHATTAMCLEWLDGLPLDLVLGAATRREDPARLRLRFRLTRNRCTEARLQLSLCARHRSTGRHGDGGQCRQERRRVAPAGDEGTRRAERRF